MKTEKQQRKFSLTVALLIGVTSFYLGNRFVLIYESSTGDVIKKASNAISELLPSFVESYHMKISFYPFAILFALLTFALAEALYAYYLSQRVNFKVGEEHGGARYGSSEEAAVLQDETEDKNMILSQNIKNKERASCGCSSAAECVPSTCKVLGPTPSTGDKKM